MRRRREWPGRHSGRARASSASRRAEADAQAAVAKSKVDEGVAAGRVEAQSGSDAPA